VGSIVGPFLYGFVASLLYWPPATWVIDHITGHNGRYPLYRTSIFTFVLLVGSLIVFLLPILAIKKIALGIMKSR
jgi:predicted PurR-regulated permease PerM